MKLSGAAILLESLKREGVEIIFGNPGGAVLPFYDALHRDPAIRHVLVRHEGAAAHAADGYARISGKTGVVLATSGPAVTNLVTGLQSAYMDSVPMVALTGQVPTHLIGRDAFQESDNIGLTRSCTKHNYLVKDASKLASIVKEAFYIAGTGRRGPVHIDLPKDVLLDLAEYVVPTPVHLRGYRPRHEGHLGQIRRAARLILDSERPVLLVGGGAIWSNAGRELLALAESRDVPVTATLMGLGAFPTSHRLFMGMLGMHGTYTANMAVHQADCLIVVGARFDDRVTGKIDEFTRANIIHIDIDPTTIAKNLEVDVPIVGDARAVLAKLLAELDADGDGARAHDPRSPRRAAWHAQIAAWASRHPLAYEVDSTTIKPQYVLETIARLTGGDAILTTGVGQHQMWAAQFSAFKHGRQWCTSGGLGAMGYGLPAALGAQLAAPGELVINVDGDGSFLLSSLELTTVAAAKLPIKTVILNNGYYGMVRQWQELVYDGRYNSVDLTGSPDFVKLAEAYGCTGMRATTPGELADVLRAAFAAPGPVVVDVVVDRDESVYPMVLPGRANKDMLISAAKLEPPATSSE